MYNSVYRLLTNPTYGGAYAFGRTTSRVELQNGRRRKVQGIKQGRDEWQVLIVDHHDGYISWAEYERNQRLIAENAGNKGLMVRRAVNRGDALLPGLLRCGHCGRKLSVSYGGKSVLSRVTAVGERSGMMALRAASISVLGAWIMPSAKRFCNCCSPSEWRQRCGRSKRRTKRRQKRAGRSNLRCNKHVLQQIGHDGNMMQSNRRTGLLPRSLSDVGISAS
jgi:hypothetical protein